MTQACLLELGTKPSVATPWHMCLCLATRQSCGTHQPPTDISTYASQHVDDSGLLSVYTHRKGATIIEVLPVALCADLLKMAPSTTDGAAPWMTQACGAVELGTKSVVSRP